jgi:flagellar basal-body rod modification protein FlgD
MSTTNSISSVINTTSNPLPDGSLRTPVQTLGQDDFLQLLVTQMTQQDPMNPMKDTEFIAQMASFSSLEQSKAMMQDMAQLRATNLLGQTVTVQDDASYTGLWSGVVSSVVVVDGTPQLVVEGREFGLGDVLSVEATTTPTLPLTVEPKSATMPAPVQGEDSAA